MALSEREQKLLDEIEQDLYATDKKFAPKSSTARPRTNGRRSPAFLLAGVMTGMVLVLLGLVSKVIIVSILGFLLILGTAALATTKRAGLRPARTGMADPTRDSPHKSRSSLQKLRWRHPGDGV